ncbi:MAG TPA: HAMP domain-containing sensor histidine kinase [Solirubrobacteraceae bacterium]
MATATAAMVPRRWLRLPTRSARLRLTLLYSGMFLTLGTAVVVVIYLLGSSGAAIDVTRAVPAPAVRTGIHVVLSQQHDADVSRLLAGAWATLALTAAASALLGWFLAGRVLRPLRDMTVAARTISAGNLHQRIALSGPEDEFKQLGDTFDDLLARLERSFAAQRRFVANAAHELRTPLTVERAVLQVALSDPQASAASLRAACEEALSSGRDHERLLDSLLTLATSERGLENREPVDLDVVARDALMACAPELERASLTISSQLEPAEASGDPALIGRLVVNLIDNATRYNQPEGRVRVRTAAAAGVASLTVVNTGPRVAPGEVAQLFEPFRRLGNDRAAGDGHHGLGLSIVRAVATAHDATVNATPGPDGGLIVTVAFPAGAGPGPQGR